MGKLFTRLGPVLKVTTTFTSTRIQSSTPLSNRSQ